MKLLLDKFLKENILLILILIISIFLRFISLESVPVGFNDDEAAFGYNAYSILKTGKDEWGKFLPFPIFESFGDWKLVGYLYLTVVSQFFFGTNEFATRLPSVIFGVLTVFATYLLAKELFSKSPAKLSVSSSQFSAVGQLAGQLTDKLKTDKPETDDRHQRTDNKTIALLSAFFLAINPWHIVASRNAFESDLLSFFISLAVYLFLKGIKNKKYLTLSFLTFATSFYIYRSSWLFVPLLISCLLYFHRTQLRKLKTPLIKSLSIICLLILPLVPVVLTFKGQSRFVQESFVTGVSRIGITNEINQRRGICTQKLPAAICTLAYNKYIFFIKSYTSNYLRNLSYETFFEKANPTGFQSFMTRSVFYLFELPLLMLGTVFILKRKENAAKVLIPWILLCPVGAAIAGIGNYGRMNIILPTPQIIAAYGFVTTIIFLKYRSMKVMIAIAMATIVAFSLTKLFIDMLYIEPFHSSRYQRYGYKELFNYLEAQKGNYNNIYISKKIDNSHQYIQYLYFEKINPKFYMENSKKHKEKDGWISFESLGSLFFVPSVPSLETFPSRSLLVVGEKEVSFPLKPVFTINYLNGDRGFEIYDMDDVKSNIEKQQKVGSNKIPE